jgi:predicted permease
MNTTALDVRYGLRMLTKAPGFTAIAVLTLALGIGANTALFSVVNSVLLNPLAYPHSGELVALYGKAPHYDKAPISYPNFLDWQRDAKAFASMAIYRNESYNVTGSGEGERLSGYMVSAGFFPTLGVSPILGRTFRADDDVVGAAPAVILSGGLWKRKFNSSPDVLGKAMVLNGTAYTIVGVIPASFSFYGNSRDLYTPIGQWNDPSFRDRRISVSTFAIGRLNPGVTVRQAQAEMDTIARALASAYPQADRDLAISVISMKEDMVGNVKPFLLVLVAAVGFLLLIACTNIANLLLARALGRSREFAIRAALGASRGRMIRQLLTESVLLAGTGGGLGLFLAYLGRRAVVDALPGTLPRANEVAMDARVLIFTLALSMLAGILFGLAPAVKTARANLQSLIQEGGRGDSGVRHRLQGFFVAFEVSLALVLLVGGGLMVRTLAALWRVNPGYNPSHAITFNVSFAATPGASPAETRARLRHFDDIL